MVNGEDADYVKKELFNAVERAGISSKVEYSLREYPNEETKGFLPYTIDENNPYVGKFIESVEEVSRRKCTIDYFKSIGDFNYIGSRLKVPTIIFGPDGGNYHTCNEYVKIDTVIDTALSIYNYLSNILCN